MLEALSPRRRPPAARPTASCSWSSSATSGRACCRPTWSPLARHVVGAARPARSPASAPTWPARAAWSPTRRRWTSCSGLVERGRGGRRDRARRGVRRQLGQPGLGARHRRRRPGRRAAPRRGDPARLRPAPPRRPIDGLRTDAFTLVAEVIEVQTKPAQPVGRRRARPPSARRPAPPGRGTVRQGIVALGPSGRRPRRPGPARGRHGARRQQRPPGARPRRPRGRGRRRAHVRRRLRPPCCGR